MDGYGAGCGVGRGFPPGTRANKIRLIIVQGTASFYMKPRIFSPTATRIEDIVRVQGSYTHIHVGNLSAVKVHLIEGSEETSCILPQSGF